MARLRAHPSFLTMWDYIAPLAVGESGSEGVDRQKNHRNSHLPFPSLNDSFSVSVFVIAFVVGTIIALFWPVVKWFLFIVIMLTGM